MAVGLFLGEAQRGPMWRGCFGCTLMEGERGAVLAAIFAKGIAGDPFVGGRGEIGPGDWDELLWHADLSRNHDAGTLDRNWLATDVRHQIRGADGTCNRVTTSRLGPSTASLTFHVQPSARPASTPGWTASRRRRIIA